MKFALIGYGRMGRAIERLGLEAGHVFPLKLDKGSALAEGRDELAAVDVAIEFSTPDAAAANIRACIEEGIPVVSGTTGWTDELEDLKALCLEHKSGLFYASNFSIGVNIMLAVNRKLAGLMSSFPQYRAFLEEVHHTRKLDAPSGTALSIAEGLIEEHADYNVWELSEDAKPLDGDRLAIKAIREGDVTGDHRIIYESEMDRIELFHHASTRDAFASGALAAAEFMKAKSGIFGMEDLLNL